MQTTKNLVLHLELSAHGELGALLDLERLFLEALLASGSRQVNSDGVAAGRVHSQRDDDTDAGIVGVGNVFAMAEAERLLVALERFVTGI